MQKNKIKKRKEYEHIAVSPELKTRFENLRYAETGKKLKQVTQEELLAQLLDEHEHGQKQKGKSG